MNTQTPAQVMSLSASPYERVEGLHFLFSMRRQGVRNLLDNIHLQVPPHCIAEAAEFLSDLLENEVDASFVEGLLALYPSCRIAIATVGSIGDSETREGLADALSHFLLGCSWPTYGDKVDSEEFSTLLKTQYGLLLRGV